MKIATKNIQGQSILFSMDNKYSERYFRDDRANHYEALMVDLIVETIVTAKVFVDVGAHVGFYACILGKLFPQLQVYAFEMDSSNFVLMEQNIQLNQLTNTQAYQQAVFDKTGDARYIRQMPEPSSRYEVLTSYYEHDRAAEKVTVSTVRLDDFFKDKDLKPDVVKIDVEGAELNVLKGMEEIIKTSHPAIFVEVHPETIHHFDFSLHQVYDFLTDYGYEIYELIKKSDEPMQKIERQSLLDKNSVWYSYVL